MKYIVCQKPGKFLIKDTDIPVRKKGEALVRIHKVGICGTDLHAYSGDQAFFTYPRILGHELAGEIVETDPAEKDLNPGDQVVIMPYLNCGECYSCRHGKPNCCSNIKVLGVHTDGGMQEYMSLPVKTLLKANALSYDQMAIVEPLAIGVHAVRRSGIKAGETVVVMGCGPIGIGIMKIAQNKGASVIAVDISEKRLQFVKDQIKVDFTVNANNDPLKQIEEITDGDLAPIVFDATGSKVAIEKGPEYMAHGGRFILVGLSKGELCFNHPAIHAKESTLMCSRNATDEDFEYVIGMISQFPTEAYITDTLSTEDFADRFTNLLNPDNYTIKAILNISNS